jgi:hypothetical protein
MSDVSEASMMRAEDHAACTALPEGRDAKARLAAVQA